MLSKKLLMQMVTMSLACLLSLPAMAQAVRGQVRGLVTDQSGSVLPGAKVTLSNVNTGVITTKPTDNAGIYVFDFVEPGTYTIRPSTDSPATCYSSDGMSPSVTPRNPRQRLEHRSRLSLS